jgi:biotin transport system substrate-specific component
MAIGHVIILAAGFAWLAYGIGLGTGKAWVVGVLPFIAGSVVKSALGATLLAAAWRLVDRRLRKG